MILVDTNLLLYAANRAAPEHEAAVAWLEEELSGEARVGLPWEALIAFHRLATSPRILPRPMDAERAWRLVRDWLSSPVAWIPQPTERHAEIMDALVGRYRITANLVPDAHLAAIAIQHGLEICSADTDFARFTEVRWRNPLV